MTPSVEQLGDMEWPQVAALYDELAARDVDTDTAPAWLADWNSFEDALVEARERAQFAYTCNTLDAGLEAKNLRFQTEIEPRAQERRVILSRKLTEAGYTRPDLEQSLRRFRTDQQLFREENVQLHAEIQRLDSEYQKVTGGMTADWDGQELPLPRLRPFMQDTDRGVRERAWKAHRRPYVEQRERLAGIFDGMRSLRQQMAKNSGFPNYRDYVHAEKYRYDYTPDDCLRFHEAVLEHVVPAARKVFEREQRRLGVQSLRPWDVGAPAPGQVPLKPFSTGDELIAGAANIFNRLDPELGRRFQTMREEGLLDLESRKGKAPGGYMTELPASRRPLIFMNAAGVADDVVTLVHEAGHAFHGFEQFAGDLLFCQRWPGMEMTEVGSMAMELLSAPYWSKDSGGYYDDADYRRARIEHLERILLFFPHCATVDAFQHWIYTDPDGADAAARDEHWLQLRRQYEAGIDYDGLRDAWVARWYQQLHIFSVPFYYIEYGIAQLGALQIWQRARRDERDALAGYRRALALGSTRPLPELFQAAGIKLAFDGGTIASLVQEVEEELERLGA